jgi:hypothetical protein
VKIGRREFFRKSAGAVVAAAVAPVVVAEALSEPVVLASQSPLPLPPPVPYELTSTSWTSGGFGEFYMYRAVFVIGAGEEIPMEAIDDDVYGDVFNLGGKKPVA